jgi:uncharacterized Tic20 family protein
VAFQLVLMGVTIAVVVATVASALTICLIPMALVLLLGVFALAIAELFYGLYAAYETYYGADFTYWKVGEFVKQQMGNS